MTYRFTVWFLALAGCVAEVGAPIDPAGVSAPLVTSPTAASVCPDGPRVRALDDYMADSRCGAGQADCLEPVAVTFRMLDGRQVTGVTHRYRATTADDPASPSNYVRPAIAVRHLRKLRDAFLECGSPLLPRLHGEIAYLLRYAIERDGALWWENREGIADGMHQSKMMYMLASLALTVHSRQYGGYGERDGSLVRYRDHYFTLAYRMSRPLARPAGRGTGGVRSSTTTCAPGGGRCVFMHSRGGGDGAAPGTALNQTGHVLKDSLDLLEALRRYQGRWSVIPVSSSAWLAEVRAWIVEGLNQLAYVAPGGAGAPGARTYMDRRRPVPMPGASANYDRPFYWAFYSWDMQSSPPRGVYHSFEHTCHYHSHNLNVVGDLFRRLARDAELATPTVAARAAMLGHRTGTGAIEPIGQSGSPNALYQWFQSESRYNGYKHWRMGCATHDANGDPVEALSEENYCFFCNAFELTCGGMNLATCSW